ncbi:MAG: pyruvate synthase [Nitrososphaerota archaeon]|nr:pyruvate synthase [Nitrososphaerota archaeon]
MVQSTDSAFRTLKDVPREERLRPGSPLCAGCGGEAVVRLALKALGPRTIVVSVPGCLALLALYPYATLTSSLLFTTFASGPAAAQGIVDGIMARVEKGKLADPNSKVMVLTGDGAAYDIGLQATSGAVQRGLDFYYLCYDNEAYGNTGFQYSSATPLAASTSTTAALGGSIGSGLKKKNLFEIWRAHNPAYLATISLSRPVDLLRKFERAAKVKGPKLFIAFSVCPTGWGSEPRMTVKLDKLAVESGIWPLKEAVDGKVVHTYIPRRRVPVEEYLRIQRRFEHLFEPSKKEETIASIQRNVDAYWTDVII